MKNQVLSIEQMKHLKELGVHTNNASMCWVLPTPPDYKRKLDMVGIHGNLKVYEERGYGIGAFTLQDILNAMPKTIEVKDERLYLTCSLFDESNKSVKGVLSIDFVSNAISYNVHGYEGVDLQIPYAVRSYPIEDGSFYHEVCNTPIRRDTLLESVYLMLCWLAENGYLKQQP